MSNKTVENHELCWELEKYIRKYIKELPANRDIINNDANWFACELTKREYAMILYRLMDSFGTPIQPEWVELIDRVRVNSFGAEFYHSTDSWVGPPIGQLQLNFESAFTKTAPRPPINAEYLLYLFLRRDEREVVIGDLLEGYGKILTRFNRRRADIWFYKQVGGSLLPLLRRALLRIGALVWLARLLRRLVS
jgi:hypothetical protein